MITATLTNPHGVETAITPRAYTMDRECGYPCWICGEPIHKDERYYYGFHWTSKVRGDTPLIHAEHCEVM